MHLAGVAAPG